MAYLNDDRFCYLIFGWRIVFSISRIQVNIPISVVKVACNLTCPLGFANCGVTRVLWLKRGLLLYEEHQFNAGGAVAITMFGSGLYMPPVVLGCNSKSSS